MDEMITYALRFVMHRKNCATERRCYFYQNFLHEILRKKISGKEYTLQNKVKFNARVTSHNVFQVVKAEISAVIDC